MNPKLQKSPSANGKFWKCLGLGFGVHVQMCWSAFNTETVRKTATSVPVKKRGRGFIKKGVSWPVVALECGFGSRERTVLYLPCEEN